MGDKPNQEFITWIHGKPHDLREWMDKHPGGPVALRLALGRDATALFESYHPLSKYARSKLKNLEISPKGLTPPSDLTEINRWEVDPFEQDLKQLLKEHLEKYKDEIGGGHYAHGPRLLGLFLTFLAVLFLGWWMLKGSWIAMLLFGPSFWVLNGNMFHDGSHFAFNKDWRLNRFAAATAIYLTSPMSWDFQHVISHHNYTNTDDDPDSRYFPRKPTRYWWLWTIKFILMTIGLQMIIGIRAWKTLKFHHTEMAPYATPLQRKLYLYGRPLWFVASLVWPWILTDMGFLKGLIFSLTVWFGYGASFGLFTQLSHLQEGCEPHIIPGEKWNWYRHQVATATNYGRGPFFPVIWWFSGGLALQIEHHLFPGINHCHLQRMSPRIQELCKKHGVEYKAIPGLFGPLRDHIRYMSKPLEGSLWKKNE